MKKNTAKKIAFGAMAFFMLNGKALAQDNTQANEEAQGHLFPMGAVLDEELYNLHPMKFYTVKDVGNLRYTPDTEAEWREYIVEYVAHRIKEAYRIAVMAESLTAQINSLDAGMAKRGAADIVVSYTIGGELSIEALASHALFMYNDILQRGKLSGYTPLEQLQLYVNTASGMPDVNAISEYTHNLLVQYRRMQGNSR
ncbi:MAG: hypothetical protein LBL21_00195 [Rickettsiales bacterium]|jgi:hypothetical protein|nr:hypothetical protein [Rickettsiales bacterium]